MSTYDTSEIVIMPRLAQLEAAVASVLTVEGTLMSSTGLAAITAAPRSIGSDVSALAKRLDNIARTPGARMLIQRTNPAELRTAETLHLQAAAALKAGQLPESNRLAARAHGALSKATGSALQQIRHGERLFADHTVTASLTTLGYRVRRIEGASCTGVYAERDHHAIAVRINDGGTMEMDVAGLAGGSCDTPIAQLRDEMSRRGLECGVLHRERHGDDRGGTLIRRAVKAGGGDIAAGIVNDVEASHTPRRSTAIDGSTNHTRQAARQ